MGEEREGKEGKGLLAAGRLERKKRRRRVRKFHPPTHAKKGGKDYNGFPKRKGRRKKERFFGKRKKRKGEKEKRHKDAWA